MRLLLDACVWGGAVEELVLAGHDTVWAGSWPHDPGDLDILRLAHKERRILVTLDKDFGELAVVRREPHSGIVRLVDVGATRQGFAIIEVLDLYGESLERGAIITVEPNRTRIRLETE